MGCVGQRDKLLVELLLGSGLLLAEGFLFGLQFGGTGFGGFSLLFLSLLHQHADFFGYFVLLGLDGVGLYLQGAALGVKGYNLVDAGFHIGHVLDFQAGDALLAMIFDIL